MRKSFTFGVKAVLFAIFFLFPCFLRAQSAIQRISATIFTRQLENGYSTSLRGGIYYRANGNMVSHFTFPKELCGAHQQ